MTEEQKDRMREMGMNPSDVIVDALDDETASWYDQVVEWLEMLEDYEGELTSNQLEFVSDMNERVKKYGQAIMIAPRQYYWLKGLFERYCDN